MKRTLLGTPDIEPKCNTYIYFTIRREGNKRPIKEGYIEMKLN